MRRPSRQGLIPLCNYCTAVLIKAMPTWNRKKNFFCSARSPSIHPVEFIPVEAHPEKTPLLLSICPVSVLIFMTLFSCDNNDGRPSFAAQEIPIENTHRQAMYHLITHKIVIIFVLASLLLPLHSTHAQDITEETGKYFREIRRGSYPPVPNSLIQPENENSILYLLEPYLRDTVYAVRAKAHEITYLVSSHSTSTHIRNQGVDILMQACAQPRPGMTGMALDLLKQFEKEDFSLPARDTLRKLVKTQTVHVDQFMKLAGFLDLKDLIPAIRPWTQPGNPTSIRWAAYLSLSRMGETSATAEILGRVKKIPVNDDVVYEVFPDLVYTRQADALDYMIDALYGDQKNCMSADAEKDVPILCGYRIMEQLAPVIVDYPLQLDEFGDLQTADYPKALEVVRQWFLKHKTYTIRNHKF